MGSHKSQADNALHQYDDAVDVIKQAILQSQYRSVKLITGEQLSLYFGIGRYISAHSRSGTWGTGAINRISEQMKKELPGLRGFSSSNMKKMRMFYEYWNLYVNRQPSADGLKDVVSESGINMDSYSNKKRSPLANILNCLIKNCV